MTKAQLGGALAVLGIVGAVATWVVRSSALDEHDDDLLADRYTEALGGQARAGAFDNAPYIAAGAVCALLVICGVILYALRSTEK